jgi:nitrite reductase (NADH) small subunit
MKVKIVHEKTRLRGHTFRSIEGMRDPRKAHQEKQAIPIPAWQDPKVPARSATVKPTQSIMAKLLKIAKTKDVPPGQAAAFTIEGQKIALFNVEGTYYAIGDTCTHRGGPLSEGDVQGTRVTCPWHGADFDLKTGAVLGPPAQKGVPSYKVVVEGDDIKVEL